MGQGAVTDSNRNDRGQFVKGHEASTRHSGEGAVKAIQRGEPLRGLAAEAEEAVYTELSVEGRYSLVLRNAARLQAAADLYWNAVQVAAEQDDLDALDRYIKRYGWLASVSLRAWAQVKADSGDDERGLVFDAVQAAREARGDEDSQAG